MPKKSRLEDLLSKSNQLLQHFLEDTLTCVRPRRKSISAISLEKNLREPSKLKASFADKKSLFQAHLELYDICKMLQFEFDQMSSQLQNVGPTVKNREELIFKTKAIQEFLDSTVHYAALMQADLNKFQQKYCIKFNSLDGDDLEYINANYMDTNDDCSDYSMQSMLSAQRSADTQILTETHMMRTTEIKLEKTRSFEAIKDSEIKVKDEIKEEVGANCSLMSLMRKSSTLTDISLLPDFSSATQIIEVEQKVLQDMEILNAVQLIRTEFSDTESDILNVKLKKKKVIESYSEESSIEDISKNGNTGNFINNDIDNDSVDKFKQNVSVKISKEDKQLCDQFDGSFASIAAHFKKKGKRKRVQGGSSSSSSISSCSTVFNKTPNHVSPTDEELEAFLRTVENEQQTRKSPSDGCNDEEESDTEAKNNEILNLITNDCDYSDQETSCSIDTSIEANSKEEKEPTIQNGDDSKEKSVKETRKRRPSWLNDSLLTAKLDDHEDDQVVERKRRKKKINLKTEDDVKSVHSESSESIYFYDVSPQKVPPSQESQEPGGTKRGRRNIREIISEESLDVATKKATREEKERVERVKENQKLLKQLSQSQVIDKDSFILDASDPQRLIVVDPALTKILKDHQKEGIVFLWNNCYESLKAIKEGPGSGCILAHCMGLGKTLQVVTLVHTLFLYKKDTCTKRVLIVVPFSTLSQWQHEFKTAFAKAERKVKIGIHIINPNLPSQKTFNQRKQVVNKWSKSEGILIVGYEAFIALEKRMEDTLVNAPDLVVCDEGHLLKNRKALKTVTLEKVKTRRRIALTGTPMQNNLKEYYHMMEFVKPKFLGTLKEFSNRFVNPIVNGQYDDSSVHDICVMKKRSHVLHKMTGSFVQRYEVDILEQYLPRKYDYVLMCQLKPLQVQLYKEHIERCKQELLFANYCMLRLIWTHPSMLEIQMKKNEQEAAVKAIAQLNASKNGAPSGTSKKEKRPRKTAADSQEGLDDMMKGKWWRQYLPPDISTNPEYGAKFVIMMDIIRECVKIGEKLLIFCTALSELDAIEMMLKQEGTWTPEFNYYRMDGTVPAFKRDEYRQNFNKPDSPIKLFLLSTRVGGLGLNLIAANRVILMDVSWNPSNDTQSIFRVYRFGQMKNCYIYRLVSCGTMEEVMYERSVSKEATAARVVDQRQVNRHYKASDIQAMYRCKVDFRIDRPTPKLPSDGLLATVLTQNDFIYSYTEHNELLQNRPDEQLDEEEKKQAWEEYETEKRAIENANVPKPPPQPASASTSSAAGPGPATSSSTPSAIPSAPSSSITASANLYHKILLKTESNSSVQIYFDDNLEPVVSPQYKFSPDQLKTARWVYETLQKLGHSHHVPKLLFIERDGRTEHEATLDFIRNSLWMNLKAESGPHASRFLEKPKDVIVNTNSTKKSAKSSSSLSTISATSIDDDNPSGMPASDSIDLSTPEKKAKLTETPKNIPVRLTTTGNPNEIAKQKLAAKFTSTPKSTTKNATPSSVVKKASDFTKQNPQQGEEIIDLVEDPVEDRNFISLV